MLLSDREIVSALHEGKITVTPLIDAKKQIGGSSIDVRLGTEFKLIRRTKQTHFDLSLTKEQIKQNVREYTESIHIEPLEPFILHPGEFALGCTLEYVGLSNDIAGRLEGRSTWGRAGLQVHSTAGLVDPGFEGILTFELHNMGKLPLPLYAGVRIAQISFHSCAPVLEGYGSKSEAKYARTLEIKETEFYSEYEYQRIHEWQNSRGYAR